MRAAGSQGNGPARTYRHRPADVLPAVAGVPYKLCAVVTGDGIYYAEQGDHGPTLFDEEAVPEGATPTAELLPG